MPRDRELLEKLVEKADRYLVALLREALNPELSGKWTAKARSDLFDTLEALDKERPGIFG